MATEQEPIVISEFDEAIEKISTLSELDSFPDDETPPAFSRPSSKKKLFRVIARYAYPAYFDGEDSEDKVLDNQYDKLKHATSLPGLLNEAVKVIYGIVREQAKPKYPEDESDHRSIGTRLLNDATSTASDLLNATWSNTLRFCDRYQDNLDREASRKQMALFAREGTIWHAVSNHEYWCKAKFYLEILVKLMAKVDPRYGEEVFFRGVFGETPLHVALLRNDGEEQSGIFQDLWKLYPWLRTAEYTHSLYRGENVLHIAIIRRAQKVVMDLLLEQEDIAKILLDGRAKGRFFNDKTETDPFLESDGSKAILGEHPLSFALCSLDANCFGALAPKIPTEAFVDIKTTEGNNLLHLIVLNAVNKKDKGKDHDRVAPLDVEEVYQRRHVIFKHMLYRRCKDLYEKLYNDQNINGYTPLELAAIKGSSKMFECLLLFKTEKGWTFGPTELLKLDLDGIDVPIGQIGQHDNLKPCILEMLVEHGRRYLVSRGHMDKLIESKWTEYGLDSYQSQFCFSLSFWMVLCFVGLSKVSATYLMLAYAFLIIMSLFNVREVWSEFCRFTVQIGDVAGKFVLAARSGAVVVGFLMVAEMNVVNARPGPARKLDIVNKFYEDLISFRVSSVKFWKKLWFDRVVTVAMPFIMWIQFVMASLRWSLDIIMHQSEGNYLQLWCRRIETSSLILAIILSLGKVVFLAIASEEYGLFLTMVFKVMDKDFLQFLIVCSVFMFGFLSIFARALHGSYAGLETWTHSVEVLIGPIVGEYRSENMRDCQHVYSEEISQAILVGYHFLVGIVLLNIFVARLNGTYSEIKGEAIANWKLQRAKVLVSMDWLMNHQQRRSRDGSFWHMEGGKRFEIELETASYAAQSH